MSALKTFRFEPLSKEQIKDYCQASGDWNKIHWDEEFAKAAGLPGIIGHGMLSMGLAARALAEWGYETSNLMSLESKFKDKALPGDQLECHLVAERGNQLDLEMVAVSDGRQILTATAMLKNCS